MAEHIFIKTPLRVSQPEVPLVQVPASAADPTPDQVHAVDAAFAHYEDKPGVLDVLSFYAGMMMIGELAKEHANKPAEDDEAEEEKPA